MDVAEIEALVSVEVDLREGSSRTVHWFVNGNQQKPFIVNVPPTVQFAVCFLLSLSLFHSFSQLSLVNQNESYEFVSLEANCSPKAKTLIGEEKYQR